MWVAYTLSSKNKNVLNDPYYYFSKSSKTRPTLIRSQLNRQDFLKEIRFKIIVNSVDVSNSNYLIQIINN